MPRSLLRRVAGRIRRTLVPSTRASGMVESEPVPLPLVGYVVAGAGGAHPASTHVRVVRRTERLGASGAAEVRQVDPAAFAEGRDPAPYVSVVVQRDVVPAAVVERFLATARERGVRVVAEVDDDFFTESGRARLARAEYDPERLASVDAMVRGADVVVVSTGELADVVRPVARHVVVVPNALDPELWHRAPDDQPGAGLPPVAPEEHRVLYMGTLTHAADLALLRPVFDGLRADDGAPVVLEVIGITEDPDDAWFRRLEPPDGHYPAFARWLVANAGRWRAGVAPLRDEEFNRAKSDLKVLEYTALGLPAVASDRPSYAAARDHGGVLVGDDAEDWRNAVRQAVAVGRSTPTATAWVRQERTLGADGDLWDDVVLGRLDP